MARARAKYEITAQDKSAGAFNSVKRRIGGLTKGLGGFRAQLAGAIGVAGLGGMIKKSLDAGDKIQKLSIKLGASTRFLSEMKHVSDLAGVSFNAFSKGLQTMQVKLLDAQNGSKLATQAFADLGLNVQELIAMKPQEQFEAIGAALKGIENTTKRTALAYQIFGGRGTELLQITQQGTKAIAEQRAEAEKLGLSLGRDQADKMAAANDAITRLTGAFQGLGNALAVEFAEPIARGAEVLQNVLLPVLRTVGVVLKRIGQALGGFAAALVALVSGNFREAVSIAKTVGSDLFSPIGGGGAVPPARTSSGGKMSGAFGFAGSEAKKSPQIDETNTVLKRIEKKLGGSELPSKGGRYAVAG